MGRNPSKDHPTQGNWIIIVIGLNYIYIMDSMAQSIDCFDVQRILSVQYSSRVPC